MIKSQDTSESTGVSTNQIFNVSCSHYVAFCFLTDHKPRAGPDRKLTTVRVTLRIRHSGHRVKLAARSRTSRVSSSDSVASKGCHTALLRALLCRKRRLQRAPLIWRSRTRPGQAHGEQPCQFSPAPAALCYVGPI